MVAAGLVTDCCLYRYVAPCGRPLTWCEKVETTAAWNGGLVRPSVRPNPKRFHLT